MYLSKLTNLFQLASLTALTLFLSACAPVEQAYHSEPENKPKLTADTFHTDDGVALPSRKWLPEGKPKAIIVALHGFNDYSHGFELPGEFFKAYGIATYAYDQRGFGASPQPGIWAGEKNLIKDAGDYVKLVKARNPGVPVYLMGESMGGALAVLALSDPSFPKVSGAILVAPALWGGENMNPLYRGALLVAAHTFPDATVTGRNLKILATNNIPLLKAMVADPLIIKETRIDAIYGVVGLMDDAYDAVPNVNTKTLLLYGAQDQVIPKGSIEDARARFSRPITFVYYPDGYHMLLRDLERKKVMLDIVHWMEREK